MARPLNLKIWMKAYELQSKLSQITNILKLYDKISLIFLLCKSSKAGIAIVDLILKEHNITARNNLFYKWLIKENIFTYDEWQLKFAEYLAILQNYRSIEILGFEKQKIKEKYLPKNNLKTFYVSSIRKVLYNLCEELSREESSKLITAIDSEYRIDTTKYNEVGSKYLEYKLFIWSEENIINLNEDFKIDLDSLIFILKSLNYNNFVCDIEVLIETVKSQFLREKAIGTSDIAEFEFYPIIDENNIGFCVIINEKVFSDPLHATRWGTEKDVERLVEVFTTFGFDIKVHTDLVYMDLIQILGYYASSIKENHSAFVLIILSHGSENVIYTSDSKAVDMSTIEMVFQAEICPNLIGKPKVFIIQSCQGEKWQKQLIKSEDTEVFCDSAVPSNNLKQVLMGPQRGDSIIAWSTVQGFASFRDKYNGSWYIQELCKELWKFGDISDLVEIFTRVNNNLRSKVYDGQFMVPSLLLSIRAKVKFPQSKQSEISGRRLMLERLIFEKYFVEFVKNSVLIKMKKLTDS